MKASNQAKGLVSAVCWQIHLVVTLLYFSGLKNVFIIGLMA